MKDLNIDNVMFASSTNCSELFARSTDRRLVVINDDKFINTYNTNKTKRKNVKWGVVKWKVKYKNH